MSEVLAQEEIDELTKVIQETLNPEDFERFRKYYKQRETSKKKKYNVDVKYEPTEVLSQNEIEQLLDAINANGRDEEDDFRHEPDTRKIKIYDFKRPDKFSKEQIRTISMMHETFARLCTTSLSAQLRNIAHIHVASVDQLTYEEFIRSIPTPTCLAIINMDPLRGNAILEIDPAITFSIIELLLGGEGDGTKAQHELTDIEMSIMEGIVVRLLGNLRESWSNVIDLRPRLGAIETNPQFCQIVHPTDMVVLITLEARIGDIEGMMNLCIPYDTLEHVLGKLSTQFWFNSKKHVVPNNSDLDKLNVTLRAEWFKSEINLKELKQLQIGSFIPAQNITKQLKVNDTVWGYWSAGKPDSKKESIKIKRTYFVEKNYMEEKNNVNYSLDGFDKIKVQIICELGRTTALLQDVKAIGEGTILELDKLAGEPVDVFANNVLLAKGEVVVIDENFGVRVTEIMDKNYYKEETNPQE